MIYEFSLVNSRYSFKDNRRLFNETGLLAGKSNCLGKTYPVHAWA